MLLDFMQDFSSPALTAIAAGIVTTLAMVAMLSVASSIQSLPGPIFDSGFSFLSFAKKARPQQFFKKLITQHGKVVGIRVFGSPIVVASDKDVVQHILTTPTEFEKSGFIKHTSQLSASLANSFHLQDPLD
eukprot:jgi/Hompol1/2510/HPOL_000065-RA